MTNVEKSRAMHGDLKVFLEGRLGLLGAVLYDGMTAIAAILLFALIEHLCEYFWPNGSAHTSVLVFMGHWIVVSLYVLFAAGDVGLHLLRIAADIRTELRRFKGQDDAQDV
jgi:hypothetical protein